MGLTNEQQAKALYDYTTEILTALDRDGLMPEMVQVGNETNSELAGSKKGEPINWVRNAMLFNAGIREMEDLADIVGENRLDPGAEKALAAYDSRRRPDILARSSAVNLLNRSLLSDLLPAQAVRSAGLGMLKAFSPLRSFFMREGLRPGSGLGALSRDLARGVGSRLQR